MLRDETNLNTNEKEFIEKYSNGMALNDDKITETLKSNITGWSLERIGNVEKALLKICMGVGSTTDVTKCSIYVCIHTYI